MSPVKEMTRLSDSELERRAIQRIHERLGSEGPPEQRIVHCDVDDEWDSNMLRDTSRHKLHVLGRAPDAVVFFSDLGTILGWRDDGRTGADHAAIVDRDAFLTVIASELELPKGTYLGKLEPVELPPFGWVHEGVLFLSPRPRPDQVLRVWVDPKNLKVIQCLRDQQDGTSKGGRPPQNLPELADEHVRKVLTRRLAVAKISTSHPEWYFQTSPDQLQPYERGAQVRVHTWRHWSDAWVTFNAENGEVLADVIDRFATPAVEEEFNLSRALEILQRWVTIPSDATLERHDRYAFAPKHVLWKLEWKRMVQGLRVNGDFLEVTLHPGTQRVVSIDRKWRPLKLAAGAATVTEQEAINLVRERRDSLEIDPAMRVESAEKVIVEYKANREEPGPTEDRIAWVVTLTSKWGWVEVHVDAMRREVLTVRRSA